MSVAICEGLTWESTTTELGRAYFPEAGLEALNSAGLDTYVRHADIQGLCGQIDPDSCISGNFAFVFELCDRPDVLLRLCKQPEPFSNAAVNIALSSALVSTIHDTPQYYGVIADFDGKTVATLQSRASGRLISEYVDSGEIEDFHAMDVKQSVQKIAKTAIQSVGIPSGVAWWDLRAGVNMFTTATTEQIKRQPRTVPVTIIDQGATVRLDAQAWSKRVTQ